MDRYEHFSKVYDDFSTNYDNYRDFIDKAILQYAGNAHSLLEVGCGTGNILQLFADRYEIAGLDISPSQLEQARKKLPGVPFYQMDMADFYLERNFDIVLCMYDAINHLLEYEDWIKTFRCVRNHLNTGGVFIFDMTMLEKLNRLSQAAGLMQQTDDVYLSVKVTKMSENVANWNVKIFKRVRDNLYELNEDNI